MSERSERNGVPEGGRTRRKMNGVYETGSRNERGATLVMTLLLSLLIAVLVIALMVNPAFIRRAQTANFTKYLAEMGTEFARGHIQRWGEIGGTLYITSSCTAGGCTPLPSEGGTSPVRLFRSGGSPVEFPMPSGTLPVYQKKNEVYGLPARRPLYDAAGNPIGTEIVGYFAYFIMGGFGDTLEIYALGGLGGSPTEISSTLTLHTKVKPLTYSEYTVFVGNPNNALFIRPNYTDPFYNVAPVRNTGMAANYASGSLVNGANRLTNFNRVYVAGPLTLDLPAGKEFYGFDLGTYFVPKAADADPSKVKVAAPADPGAQFASPVYIRSTDQLFTNPSNTTGMPSPKCDGCPAGELSQLQDIMQQLRNNAQTDGLLISGNTFTLRRAVGAAADNPSYAAPGSSAYRNGFVADFLGEAPGPDDPANQSYNITLTSAGNIQVTNILNDYAQTTLVWKNNVSQGIPGSIDYPISSLKKPIVYVKGNANISGTLNGRVTVVAEGKITVTDSLKYHDQTVSVSGTGTTVSPEKSADMLGLITPRRIDLNPQSVADKDNMVVSASLMEIGSNPTGVSDYDANWTIQLGAPLVADGNLYNSITFFGSQIQYARNANWLYKYRNGRPALGSVIDQSVAPTNPFRMYDLNLLDTQPPLSPAISKGYNIIYWAIVNNVTGGDITYKH